MFDTTHDTKDIFIGQFKHRSPPKVVPKPKVQNEEDALLIHKTIKTDFSKKVIEYRRANKLTQQQFAQKLNVKVDIVKQIEQGTLMNPNVRLLNRINAICGRP